MLEAIIICAALATAPVQPAMAGGVTYWCIGMTVFWEEVQPAGQPMSFLVEYGAEDSNFQCYDDIGGSVWGRSLPDGPWHVLETDMPQFSFHDGPGPYYELFLPIKLSETVYSPNGGAFQFVEMLQGQHEVIGGDPTTALREPPLVLENWFIKLSGIQVEIAECPADLDRDGAVGIVDMMTMLGQYGDPFDIADFLHLLQRWGGCGND